MRDPYDVLGVARNADQNEIKRAFRRLAKKLHPDANTSDPKAQDKFAELNSAHEILSDPETRGKFDRGEIDAEGKPRGFEGFPGGGGGFRRGPRPDMGGESPFESFHFSTDGMRRGRPQGGGFGAGGFDDVISDILGGFSRGGGGGRAAGGEPGRGNDIEITVPLPLERIMEGGPTKVRLPDGRTVEVKIPPRAQEGYRLRLKGQGEPSPLGGPPGDAFVVVTYAPHPVFRVDGADLKTDQALPLADAVLGTKLRVPTLTGSVELSIPAWTSSGRTFRLRGKGLPKSEDVTGDLLITVRIALPETPDAELEALMRRRREEQG
ncbi:DnaJ C-terminal domain-containing protein [Ancylobacter terrae]|uniref:DnaJ C-terminal domain-containing protein n=1 Tax=Ancylobacter sp. sgz301288 TaxID=3342077 RepID=UPI00385E0185